jgi:hypothetical protein
MKKQQHNMEFFKKVLEEVFLEYKKKLRINKSWKINVQIHKNKDLFAEVFYDYKNREFTIYINETMHGTIKTLEDSVIHEFWHILLVPYKDKLENLICKAGKERISNSNKQIESFRIIEESLVRKFTRIITGLERQRKLLEKENRFLKRKLKNK